MIGPRGPFIKIMQRIILFLLLLISLNTARSQELVWQLPSHGTLLDVRLFDENLVVERNTLPDPGLRDEKIKACMTEYMEKQSRSYTRIVQQNLYDLIYNFDNIIAKIYGKKSEGNVISYKEKLEALAKVQCELYNTLK